MVKVKISYTVMIYFQKRKCSYIHTKSYEFPQNYPIRPPNTREETYNVSGSVSRAMIRDLTLIIMMMIIIIIIIMIIIITIIIK